MHVKLGIFKLLPWEIHSCIRKEGDVGYDAAQFRWVYCKGVCSALVNRQ